MLCEKFLTQFTNYCRAASKFKVVQSLTTNINAKVVISIK